MNSSCSSRNSAESCEASDEVGSALCTFEKSSQAKIKPNKGGGSYCMPVFEVDEDEKAKGGDEI